MTAQDSSIELTDLSELPAPEAVGLYRLGPIQNLQIDVVGAEEISGTYFVDDRGVVEFPYVGEVDVTGRTPSQLASVLASGLRGDYIVDPQVRVRPEEVTQPLISVGGQVAKPGAVPAAISETLLRAVNNAGGLAEFADSGDVLVQREVQGRRYIGVYNLEAIQRGNYPDPAVYPNDIITVGESSRRRTLETILQYVPLLSSTAILIDRVGR
ncbi:polysaccharide export protein [Erythrobacteraceae bacterium WH01K]|nr:polysaccharide export protein [Erythrobacteraceae bacterium WH01K]